MDCCHNEGNIVPDNECTRPIPEELKIKYDSSNSHTNNISNTRITHIAKFPLFEAIDYRPLECRLFPFDVKEIDGKLMWIKKNSCHESQQLHYEKHIDFFERKFSREVPLSYVKKYVAHNKLKEILKPLTEEHQIIREVIWQTEVDYHI